MTKSLPFAWPKSISYPIKSTNKPLGSFIACTVFVYTLTPNPLAKLPLPAHSSPQTSDVRVNVINVLKKVTRI